MAQKTAVDWLYEELWKQTDFSLPSNILEKAKEMEKEQIEIAFEQGMVNSADYYIPKASGKEIIPEFENYYNETYR